MFAMLVVTLIALAAAVAAWLRPTPDANSRSATATPTFTVQQIADAKAKVCAAHNLVHRAVEINTGRQNPVPGDEIGRIAVAANARVALYDGGAYLLARLAEEPATPKDLENAVRSLANSLQEYAMNTLANAPDPVQDSLRNIVGTHVEAVDRLCK